MAMSTVSGKAQCFTCKKITSAYNCKGCSNDFCFNHLIEHRQTFNQHFDGIENDRDQLQQRLVEYKNDSTKHLLIEEINKWEEDSINKIKQRAEQCRQLLVKHFNKYIINVENKLTTLTDQLKNIRQEDEFNEIDLDQLKTKLTKLTKEFDQPPTASIQQNLTSFINKISVVVPFNTKWKQHGITIAGRNGQGDELNQLNRPRGIFIDDQIIYIVDSLNHRIVTVESNANSSEIVAGGNGLGSETNQLNTPADVIFDKQNNSLIISDRGNRRVIRWCRQNNTNGQIIIEDIDCWGLAMDKNGYLYVSDQEKHEVKRWKIGDKDGTVVAGGNGQGDNLNQLIHPTHLFIDEDYSLYVSDAKNYRVMKWMKDAKEGIVVAGGNGFGNSLRQLSHPYGVIADEFGQIYVADYNNHRVMRWNEEATEGTIVIGGNGHGQESNRLNNLVGLSFDLQGNLYIVDQKNNRIQKFEIDLD